MMMIGSNRFNGQIRVVEQSFLTVEVEGSKLNKEKGIHSKRGTVLTRMISPIRHHWRRENRSREEDRSPSIKMKDSNSIKARWINWKKITLILIEEKEHWTWKRMSLQIVENLLHHRKRNSIEIDRRKRFVLFNLFSSSWIETKEEEMLVCRAVEDRLTHSMEQHFQRRKEFHQSPTGHFSDSSK